MQRWKRLWIDECFHGQMDTGQGNFDDIEALECKTTLGSSFFSYRHLYTEQEIFTQRRKFQMHMILPLFWLRSQQSTMKAYLLAGLFACLQLYMYKNYATSGCLHLRNIYAL